MASKRATRAKKSAPPRAAPRRAARSRDEPPPRVVEAGPLVPADGVEAFRAALTAGEPWYPALLEVIGRWVSAEETVDGVHYRYLIAGEAFDWLRLAQRLLEAAGDAVPADEAERLLLFGLPPEAADGADDESFARAIGGEKHRAHLNFRYGVIVEEALLLSAEQELQKAGRLAGERGGPADVAAYERVYGQSFDELMGMYDMDSGVAPVDSLSMMDFQEFTYWCSKHRFRTGEPARVASDTRKALALLSTMEAGRARLARLSAGATAAGQPRVAVIEGSVAEG